MFNIPLIRLKPTREGPCVPLFVVQMPQKTFNRLGLGGRAWELFQQACLGIDLRQADMLDTFIDLKTYQQILTLGMRLFGPAWLLRWYVEDTDPAHMGPVGMATISAPTFDEGLRLWLRHTGIIAPHIQVSMLTHQHDLIVRTQMLENMGYAHNFYKEISIFVTRRMLQDLSGGKAEIRVRFDHTPLMPLDWYAETFGVVPEVSSQGDSLVMDRTWLEQENEGYTPLLHQRALEECRQLEENLRQFDCIRHQVRRLLTEAARNNRFYNLDQVAEHLHMSSRTLTRRLQREGTSFRDLQCEVRLELAKQLLQQTRLPIKTICGNAGFTNMSAFSRAFRKYTRLTPSAFRHNA